ncbi:uncharacterized protein C2orf16-like [Limulus polyphemus]|uniref:Uncharacterized protein C2orf16-like n=1 Tax=Limulus polyphemus TaxID=6850 RepID=A0ABM1T0U9_LIMPO|nr:uncharacterized protein C2orf16-like [Limulus polyphemus]
MAVQDGERSKLGESESPKPLNADVVSIHVTEHIETNSENLSEHSSLSLPRRSSYEYSASRLDEGVVVRVASSVEWKEGNSGNPSRSSSVLSIASSHNSHGEKTHRRQNHASRRKSSSLYVGEGTEGYENSGHKSRNRSRHYLAPPAGGSGHSRRHSMEVSSQHTAIKKKRKSSYPENEVRRADRRSSGSNCGPSCRSSRSEEQARRSSRVSRRPTKSSEKDHHKEDVELENGIRRRRMIIIVICSVSIFILLTSVILVAVTLSLSPTIDKLVRKENEEILRGTSSTSSPSVNGATVNKTFNFTGQPG